MSLFRLLTILSMTACVAAGCGPSGADLRAAVPVPPAAMGGEELAVESGCDELFVARNPQSTLVLVVRVPGILERAQGAELPYREVLEVRDGEGEGERGGDGIAVRLEEGADLDYWCTDVLERPPRIDAAWVGVAGTAAVELVERLPASPTARGDRPPPTRAVVRLDGVVLAPADGGNERRPLPDLEIDATLGVPEIGRAHV